MAVAPKIQGSERLGTNVVILDHDSNRVALLEARSEQDSRMQRISFYAATSIRDAKKLIKEHTCTLAIFCDGVDGKDFVSIQHEMKDASPGIKSIPLVDVPSIRQLNESRKIGGVIRYASPSDLDDYDAVASFVFSYIRECEAISANDEVATNFSKVVLNFLLTDHQEWAPIKELSAHVLNEMLLNYDLSPQECAKVAAAERLFLPWIERAQYKSLLREDEHQLARYLSETASWESKDSTPLSIAGLIITLSNYIALGLSQSLETTNIINKIGERPHFLKHPAVRTLNKEKLEALLVAFEHLQEGAG